MMKRLFCTFVFLALAAAQHVSAATAAPFPGLPTNGTVLSQPTQIMLLMTLLTLLPAIIMSITPFLGSLSSFIFFGRP